MHITYYVILRVRWASQSILPLFDFDVYCLFVYQISELGYYTIYGYFC